MTEEDGVGMRELLARADPVGDSEPGPEDAFDFDDGRAMDDATRINPQFARDVFGLRYVGGDSEKAG